jgi:hypothetical protein
MFKVWDDKKNRLSNLDFYINEIGELMHFDLRGWIEKADKHLILILSSERHDKDKTELYQGDIITNGAINGIITKHGPDWRIFTGGVSIALDKGVENWTEIGNKYENPEMAEKFYDKN